MITETCKSCGAILDNCSGECLCTACVLRDVLTVNNLEPVPDEFADVPIPVLDEPLREAHSENEFRTISHFEIISPLGRGGMGIVYKALDRDLDRMVALKILPQGQGSKTDAKARFLREARAASALDHINIGTVYEIGETDDHQWFIAMAYYQGQTLAQLMQGKPLPLERTVDIANQLAAGLSVAHSRGIVHRDVKPGNIMVTPEGVVKLLDFGIAKITSDITLTEFGTTGGTAAYMSPEQARGEYVDHRTDIWSLGLVMFEMLTGRRPFTGDSAPVVLRAILEETPPPVRSICPEIPVTLANLVDRCLAADPEQRPADMEDVLDGLRSVSGASPSVMLWNSLRRIARRKRSRILALTVTGLLAVSLAVTWMVRNYTVTSTQAIDSLAVLPFSDLTGNPVDEYFSLGMQEALIGELSKIGGLRVISMQSTKRFRDTELTIPEIAGQLNVEGLITASLFREGETVHLNVHLVEIDPKERERWVQAFSGNMANVLTMNRDVARAIAAEIRIQLTTEDDARLNQTRTITPASYEAYLKGMYHLNKPGAENHRLAMEFFEEAVEKNPADPYAYVGLSQGYLTLSHGPGDDFDPLSKARAALDRALRLDPTIPEAQTALAMLKLYRDWDLPGFLQTANLALELNPNSPMMHYHLAWYHVLTGNLELALAEHQRARELDPLTPLHSLWLPGVYMCFGMYEEAIACAEDLRSEYPSHAVILFIQGVCEGQLGNHDRAIELHEQMAVKYPKWKCFLGGTYALAGRMDDARRIMDEWSNQPLTPWNAAGRCSLAASLGNLDEAFYWLEHRPAHDWIPWVGRLPVFAPLWDDPRLADFLERHDLLPLLEQVR